ncbi:MAG: tryptophan synthase subunit alpha [Candidatus Aminicenantes bacterium]
MGKIGVKFKILLSQGRKALIPFFTALYPSKELFRELLKRADDAGADCIELGIPFSDPLADGKMIQYSSQWALRNGFDFSLFLEEITRLEGSLSASLILMSYFNPILQRGVENFAREINEAKIEGVIVPDLPLEESFFLKEALSAHDIDLISIAAPTTGSLRLTEICRHSQGFIYLVSLTGVTGIRERLSEDLFSHIRRVKKITSKPLCVGFGISSPHQAEKAAEFSDGIIVGSALINLVKGREKEKHVPLEVENFLKEMRRVI